MPPGPKPGCSTWLGDRKAVPTEGRQCERIRTNGEQCGRWKIPGKRFCAQHCQRTGRKATGFDQMTRFYRRHMSKNLADALEEALAQPLHEQLSLVNELALIRDMAGTSVATYDAARAKIAVDPANEKLQALHDKAGLLLHEHMKMVGDLCEKAARVNAMSKDHVSVTALNLVINQLVTLVYRHFDGLVDPIVLEAFNDAIKTQIRLPMPTGSGYDLTPEMAAADMRAMDATIPHLPHEGNGKP